GLRLVTQRATTSRPSLMTSPVAIFSIGHNAELNTVSHSNLIRVLRPEMIIGLQGQSGHSLLCRIQSTRRREGPAHAHGEKYQLRFPSSRRTACRQGLTTPSFLLPIYPHSHNV